MRELDLHGLQHWQSEILVVEELSKLSYDNPNGELRIITGNSQKLQDKIITLLNRYKYKWVIPSSNLGTILVSWVETEF